MLRRFLFLVVLTMFSVTISEATLGAVREASHSQAGVSWLFNIRNDKYGNPRGKVSLIVGGRKVLILPKAAAQYRLLNQTEYKSHDVPATAITACTGWWAGQGEDLYVVRRKKQLVTSSLTHGGKSMSFDELLPTLRELNRADKLRAMQFLVFELAKEEGALFNADSDYPVWSPYNAFEAASILLDALKLENKHA